MNCKKVQDLIITDYIDGEADEQTRGEIQKHLNACRKCKQFEESLLKAIAEPFKDVEELKPPERVWQSIKESIEEGEQRESALSRFLEGLKNSSPAPGPALALATVAVILIAIVAVTHLPLNGQIVSIEQLGETSILEFLSGDENGAYTNGEFEGFGTAIEEFLL